jgi:hypothetical protein
MNIRAGLAKTMYSMHMDEYDYIDADTLRNIKLQNM